MGITHSPTHADDDEVSVTEYEADHVVDWISPSGDEYLPIVTRMERKGLVYYEDPYIIIRTRADTDIYVSWLAFGKVFGFGTYEWRAKAANAVANAYIYLGLFERRHGWAPEGGIFLHWNGTKWVFDTSNNTGAYESTDITGVTFTDENKFKVEWSAGSVKFYVNDVLKATHTTRVPQTTMQLFAEVYTASSAPASEPFSYFRAGSFKQLA